MTKVFSLEQVRSRLTEAMTAEGPKVIAQRCGVGVPFLYAVRQGNARPSDKVLKGLGMVWAVIATPVPADAPPEDQ